MVALIKRNTAGLQVWLSQIECRSPEQLVVSRKTRFSEFSGPFDSARVRNINMTLKNTCHPKKHGMRTPHMHVPMLPQPQKCRTTPATCPNAPKHRWSRSHFRGKSHLTQNFLRIDSPICKLVRDLQRVRRGANDRAQRALYRDVANSYFFLPHDSAF